ncbi:DUS1L [Symbiodinium microadriaticum]|nr:DUS1L [Symbiodinium microadriaticum]
MQQSRRVSQEHETCNDGMATRSISNRIAGGRRYADLLLRQRCRWQLAGIRCASTLTEVAPSEKENNTPRRLATPPRGFRRMTLRDFDIPIENKPEVDLSKQAEEPDEDAPVRISEITGQEVQSLWPPTPLIDMKSRDKLMESLDQNELMEKVDEEERREVTRPFLWLQHEEQDFVGNEDVGRFVKIARDDLLEHLPEGGCGELSRDLTLIPDRTRDVGLMVRKLSIEAEELWCRAGGDALGEAGRVTPEQKAHEEEFCSILGCTVWRILAETLRSMLDSEIGLEPEPVAERKADLNDVRKKDAPKEDDHHGLRELGRAQEIQQRLVEANLRSDKPQRVLVAACDVLQDTQTWPVPDQLLPWPELASEAEAWAPLYGNLYPQSPPSRRRSVQDGFATPEECRDACGFCIRVGAMYCMFRRGGQTSLAVGPSLERRMGAKGAELFAELVERTRRRISADVGLLDPDKAELPLMTEGEPLLYQSGALLTRLQADWDKDMWDVCSGEVYWNAHVDKAEAFDSANVASYDYAALLYLNTQGEHFEGGDFAFVDAGEDCLVSPKRGRLLAFTAGPENLHQESDLRNSIRFELSWVEPTRAPTPGFRDAQELISQLSELQHATDAEGRPRIRKAGFLLDGHKGTGKSQVLNLLAMWARKNGWLVVLEPTPGRYAREIAEIKRSNNGVYIQSEFAQQFLEALSLANRHMLEEIPVDNTAYGSRAIDGESQQAVYERRSTPNLPAAAMSAARPLPLGLREPVLAMAPMVTQSDYAFRRLVRAHGCTLCYTEMLMASRFAESEDYRRRAFGSGVAAEDHPLVVQFAANDPQVLLRAALHAQELGADAVDLNLGCPQWKAKLGHSALTAAESTAAEAKKTGSRSLAAGSFQSLEAMVAACSQEPAVSIPVFCKIRLQPTEAETLDLSTRLQRAGCALLAVHGRRLESEKARRDGPADLLAVAELRAKLSLPVLSNGNVRCAQDVTDNLKFTSCEGIMVAEQLLRDPALFSRVKGVEPAPLELIDEYLTYCLELDGSQSGECFSVWDARNVDVLRNHLRSLLVGAVGTAEAEPGTQQLIAGPRARTAARFILDWWRIQQAKSVEDAVMRYRERCHTIQPCTEAKRPVTRRLYEPLIEKTVDREVDAQSLSGPERLQRIAEYRRQVRIPSMADVLKPQNVWEIVDFGLDNEQYAVQAVAETFVQLQRQTTHPVAVIVDDWNECFPCSEYVSIRYDNTRFNGYIPSYHLSMPRAFHRWDGHKFRRGVKICATSWMRYKRRQYRPELLGVRDFEIRTVRNFTQQEFANYVMYLRIMGVLHCFPAKDLEYFYMMTQGNGWQARKVLSTLYWIFLVLKMLRSSGDDARHPRSWQKHRQLRWLSVLSLAVMVSTVAFALPSEPPQDVARVSRPMTVRDATDLSRKIYNMEDSQALDFLERWFQGQQDLGGLRRMTPRVRESLRMVMNTIIKAAGSEGKLSQSYTWYQRMREAKIDTNPRTFGKLVTAAAQAGHVEDAELWLDSMVEEGFKPDLVTISSVITACCEAKEPLRAERWFQLLLQQGLTPDLIAYNSMIDAHAEAGDGEKAAAWLQKAVDAGIDVSTACYNAVIKAYCRQGDLEGANAWLEKAKAAGRGLDIMSYNTVLNYFAGEGDLQKAQDWFGKLKASGLQLDQVSFNTMIKAAVAADKLPQTEEYIQEMLSNRLQPTAATYVSLVSAYGDQGDLETAQLWYDKAARVNKTNKIIDTSLAKAHVKVRCPAASAFRV